MNPIQTLINDTLALDEVASVKMQRAIENAPKLARIAQIAVEALEDAPHDLLCPAAPPSPSIYKGCDCWKSRALADMEREAGK